MSMSFTYASDEILWSPDGRYLAQVERSLTENLVLGINLFDTRMVDPNNRRITPLLPTGIAAGGTVYAWAPDSSRIAYTASLDTIGIPELYTVRTDGSENRKINVPIVVGEATGGPYWSPNGTHIAYRKFANQATDVELYTVRPDGTDNWKINAAPVENDFSGIPFWSPDSSRIAYLTDQDADSVSEIYLSTPDGVININISGPLVPGGDALKFAWAQ